VNSYASTKERILTAAELLFAQRGFDGASLRQLTAAAGVNLAAVNYHFGSKDRLVEEVFRRRLDTLNAHRLAALSKVAGRGETTLEDVLDAFIRPALALSSDGSGSLFMRVLARAFAEHDVLSREELYWRIDLVTGALTHAMSGFGMIQRKSDVSEAAHREQTVAHLVRFAVAGLSHP
jgi:AcrR family transcriptional regulator